MNIQDFHKRAWVGLLNLRRRYPYAPDEARIIVHPATRAMLAMETDTYDWQRDESVVERYRGTVLEVDSRISEDSILIRFEVEA